MERELKIAIIGDFNYTYNSHHATNLSIDHAAAFLEVDCDFYWISVDEYLNNKQTKKDYYDAYWIAPGPIKNKESIDKAIEALLTSQKPVLITGEAFKNNIDVLSKKYQVDLLENGDFSETTNKTFEKVELTLETPQFRKLYEYKSKIELTDNHFSLYPAMLEKLSELVIDIEAINQHKSVEMFSVKEKKFFVATQCYPQVSSTRESSHPLIYTFLKAILI
jgi:CTP synthase (UTP-ammonia lyase)